MTIPIWKELAEIGQDMPRDNSSPNPDEVICPGCGHKFRAIPQNVQEELAAAQAKIADLSAFVMRLSRAVSRLEPGNTLPAQATRFLQRSGLTSALRNDRDLPDQDISETLADLESFVVGNAILKNKIAELEAQNDLYRRAIEVLKNG